jgi:hypothetical protein
VVELAAAARKRRPGTVGNPLGIGQTTSLVTPGS